MKILLSLKQIKQAIKPILTEYGIKYIYLFGSYARDEATEDSDVDIYCYKGNIKTFFDQGYMKEKLEKN